ncbi:putative ORFan [Cotonvirus japonicus]|uniref:ORFan n=1 Tax=Cotonvirus japonicus TaxID=2811091 RepID=A0ABM7NTA8_9VIRU|nr:putative ORFan [Cotonvirus japonicus]BCS83346.1 putative ORFan [Cotonvirus japonicus]
MSRNNENDKPSYATVTKYGSIFVESNDQNSISKSHQIMYENKKRVDSMTSDFVPVYIHDDYSVDKDNKVLIIEENFIPDFERKILTNFSRSRGLRSFRSSRSERSHKKSKKIRDQSLVSEKTLRILKNQTKKNTFRHQKKNIKTVIKVDRTTKHTGRNLIHEIDNSDYSCPISDDHNYCNNYDNNYDYNDFTDIDIDANFESNFRELISSILTSIGI